MITLCPHKGIQIKTIYDNMIVPVAPICNEFCIGYIYILKTLDSASADT